MTWRFAPLTPHFIRRSLRPSLMVLGAGACGRWFRLEGRALRSMIRALLRGDMAEMTSLSATWGYKANKASRRPGRGAFPRPQICGRLNLRFPRHQNCESISVWCLIPSAYGIFIIAEWTKTVSFDPSLFKLTPLPASSRGQTTGCRKKVLCQWQGYWN